MQIGNRLRCDPDLELQQVLWRWIGSQEFIYNCKTKEDRYFRSFAKKALSLTGMYAPVDQTYKQFKDPEITLLHKVPSQILRNGAVKWFNTYQRFFKKLCQRPTLKSKHGRRSVMISNEIFRFQKNTETGKWEIELGTVTKPVGILPVRVHREFSLPKTIYVNYHNGHWHVSFSYENTTPEPSDDDTSSYLSQFTEAELQSLTVGVDRGVKQPFVVSNGEKLGFSTIQTQRIVKKEKQKARHQRRFARRQAGSKRQKKAMLCAQRCQRYINNVRQEVAHQTSYKLAAMPSAKLIVFEDLKIGNMTRSAKGTLAAPGKKVTQKSGLNKAILGSIWGATFTYTQYKARRRGKLVMKVPAHHSSQECSQCEHISSDNRLTRDRFICQSCGYADDADHNASLVIKKRGIKMLLSGQKLPKPVKQVKPRKKSNKKVGAESSEPVAKPPTLDGDSVSHQVEEVVPPVVLESMRRETPTTTLCV